MTDYEQFIKLLEILNFELECSKGMNKYSKIYNNEKYFFKIPMDANNILFTKQLILCNKTSMDMDITKRTPKITFKEINETVEYLKDEFKYELRKIKIDKIL